MCRQPVTHLCRGLPQLSQGLGRKGRQLVAIFLMACEREHLRAQSHELDAVLIVPSYHLDGVTRIGQPQALDPLLASCYIWRLGLVRPVLGGMLCLRRICEWVSVLNDGGDATCPGAEDGGFGGAKIGI